MRDSWRSATLGEILEPLEHRAGRESNFEVLSVTEKRGIIPQTEVFNHRVAINDISKYKVLEPGDIAFNPYLLWCGAVGQWKGERPGVVSPVYEAFRARATAVARYIGLVFESGTLTPYFDSTAIGSIVRRRRTTLPVFNEAPINLPPIIEQKRIVDVMAAVDTYIAALQHQADDARAARNAVLHELLTTGGDEWTETVLGKIALLGQGGAWGSDDPSQGLIEASCLRGTDLADLIEGHHPNAPIRWVTERELTKAACKESMILIETSGSKCGRSVLLTHAMLQRFVRPVVFSNFCRTLEMDLNLITGEYAEIWFSHAYEIGLIPSYRATSAMPNLDVKSLLRIEKILLPPLQEQKRIVDIVATIDSMIRAAEHAVADAKRLRSGLLSDLLSGEHEIPDSYDRLLGAA